MEDTKEKGGYMENITNKLTKKEEREVMHARKIRDLAISNAKARVIKAKIVRAYEELDSIRFDYVGDTALRDDITIAKKNLEFALADFLLGESYWLGERDRIKKMTPEEYHKSLQNTSPIK